MLTLDAPQAQKNDPLIDSILRFDFDHRFRFRFDFDIRLPNLHCRFVFHSSNRFVFRSSFSIRLMHNFTFTLHLNFNEKRRGNYCFVNVRFQRETPRKLVFFSMLAPQAEKIYFTNEVFPCLTWTMLLLFHFPSFT